MPRPLSDSVHGWTFACCLGLARALERGFAPLVADRYAAPSAGDMLPSATRISPRFSGSVEGRLRSPCVDRVAALPDTAGT